MTRLTPPQPNEVFWDRHSDPEDGGNERQWREDDVADSYEDDPEDGAR